MSEPNHVDPGRPADLVPEDDAIIGRAFRWSMAILVLLAAAAGLVFWLTRPEKTTPVVIERGTIAPPDPLVQAAPDRPEVTFTDVTAEAGIDFVHTNGAVGEKLLPETMGGGCAFFDADGDGDQDVLFVNSGEWEASRSGESRPRMALYRNDGRGRFTDATAEAGLDVSFYGMGVAVGDYDNDGREDLFLTALGSNHLFHNDGGTFREVTETAGVAGEAQRWSTSAGFLDYDRDGLLDLFVCHYVQWSRELDLQLNFTLNGTDRAYGPPKQYRGTHASLYHNEGDGTFVDVSESSGIQVSNPATGEPMGKALAATFADIDGDGWIDISVANDTVQNFLFQNNGDGTFKELGARSGVGFDGMGAATGAMGIDCGAFANEQGLGIGIGNFANETTSFYVQQGDAWQFADRSSSLGIGSPSRLRLTFGLFFFDYDLDGWLDLLQANGHLESRINEIQPSQQYRQPAQLFWNRGPAAPGRFVAVPVEACGDLARPLVGRGASYADIDGDGDLDVLITQVAGPPLLLRNEQALDHNWIRLRLQGRSSNRDAIGAWVELVADGIIQRRQVMPTRSYLSQVELPLTFGLGKADSIESLTIRWPNGRTQVVAVESLNREIIVLEEG